MFQIISVMGSLGVFLFGMRVMSDALRKLAAGKMQSMLRVLTANRFLGVLTGLIVTAVIQSSSATMVILVGFVNAGLLRLCQAVGIIMGANIGTTLTAWIVSLFGFRFDIGYFVMPAIALGLPFIFCKGDHKRGIGEVLVGFGLLFMGIDLLKRAMPDINSNLAALEFMKNLTDYGYRSFLLFILIGAILAVLIQSSSASMAITITMAYRGWISYDIACAMVLGQNIGTTATALIAAAGMNVDARRTAWAHLLFNSCGVLWMCLLFVPFSHIVDILVPGSVFDAAAIPLHLSAFHSAFNIANMLVFIGFVPGTIRVMERLIPQSRGDAEGTYDLVYTKTGFSVADDTNRLLVKQEIAKLSQLCYDMILYFLNALEQHHDSLLQTSWIINKKIQLAETMCEKIDDFLATCRSDSKAGGGNELNALLIIVNELHSIAAGCSRLIDLLRRRERKNFVFHKKGLEQIIFFSEEILDFIRLNTDAMQQNFHMRHFDVAEKMEKAINTKRDMLRKISRRKMEKGADIRAELLFMDIIRHLEQLGDYSIAIARTLKGLN